MSAPINEKKHLGSKLILVVDDISLNQTLVKYLVEGWGCEVDIAPNGKIAVEMILANDYDMVLMDIRMPVMDGIEATKYIRSLEHTKSSIPIIAVTANTSIDDVLNYLSIGINNVIEKPIDSEQLYRVMEQYLKPDEEEEVIEHTPTNPIYNLDMFENRERNDEFLQRIVHMLVDAIPFYVQKMDVAILNRNIDDFNASIHAMLGTFGYFNVRGFQDKANLVRYLCRLGHPAFKYEYEKFKKIILIFRKALKDEVYLP